MIKQTKLFIQLKYTYYIHSILKYTKHINTLGEKYKTDRLCDKESETETVTARQRISNLKKPKEIILKNT